MPAPTISVQLYSLRDHLADLPGALGRVADLGIGAVEPFTVLDRPDALAAALAATGIEAPTAQSPFLSDHIDYQGHSVPLPPLAVTLQAARVLGVRTLFDPMVAPSRWRSAEDVARTAERLNTAAEAAAALDMQVGYHNHSFEFHHRIEGTGQGGTGAADDETGPAAGEGAGRRAGEGAGRRAGEGAGRRTGDGTEGDLTAYEYFVSLLDPRVVLEVDVYWAALAGQDVPALLRRLAGRVHALHVKDGILAADPFADGATYDPEALDQRPAGRGDLPLPEILASCPRALDVIEFDRIGPDVLADVEASARYLREAGDQG